MGRPAQSSGAARTRTHRSPVRTAAIPILLAGLVLALALPTRRIGRQPETDGRTLLEWLTSTHLVPATIPTDLFGHVHEEFLEELQSPAPDSTHPAPTAGEAGRIAAEAPRSVAIRRMGPQALPLLVRWIDAGPSRLERACSAIARHAGLPVPAGNPARDDLLRAAALDGFRILGPAAAPALPGLSNHLFASRPNLAAGLAIAATGPAGIELLRQAILGEDPAKRDTAARIVCLIGPGAGDAAPALVTALERGAWTYPVLAALGRTGSSDPRIVPLLRSRIDSDRELTPHRLEVLLIGLRREAVPEAVPGLVRRLDAAREERNASDEFLYMTVLHAIAPGRFPRSDDPSEFPGRL